jgi:hypothetical protein
MQKKEGNGKFFKSLKVGYMGGLDQIKNEQLFSFSHLENGIAGYKHFHGSLPA